MVRSDDKNVVIVAEDVRNGCTLENVAVKPVNDYTSSEIVHPSEASALQSSFAVWETSQRTHEQMQRNIFCNKSNHERENNSTITKACNGNVNTASHEMEHPCEWELQERLQSNENNSNNSNTKILVVTSPNVKHTCSSPLTALSPVSGEVVLWLKTHSSLPISSSPLGVEALVEQEQQEEEEEQEKMIARNKLLARIGYFGMYAGMSGASPFYGVLLTDRGLSPTELGVVVALNPLSTLIILPYLAYIADRYKCGRQILLLTTIATTVSLFVLTILPHVPLLIVAFIMLIHFIGKCPIAPFYDQHSMAILPTSRKGEWGSMRCFGGYGWGVFAPFASLLIGACGWWTAAMLYVIGYAIMMICYDAIRLRSIPHGTERKFTAVIGYAFVHQRILLFLIAECFMGLGYSLIGTFLFVFLKSIGAPSILLGISITMTVVVEIPLFTFSRVLHSRFSDRELLAFSMVAWSFRVVCYSLLYHPWLVLLLEPLHGLTFGLMWISGIHFVNSAFPSELSHTANGLLSSAAFGVGPVIGNVIGGAMYSYWGPRWMFRVMALVMTLLSGVFFVVDYYLTEHGRSILAAAERVAEKENEKTNKQCAINSTELVEKCNTTSLLREDVRVKDEADESNEMLTSEDCCDSHE